MFLRVLVVLVFGLLFLLLFLLREECFVLFEFRRAILISPLPFILS